MTVRFGECVFDPETRELFRSGHLVHVAPKSFRLLELLLARRPKAIGKEELIELLWPGTFVAEGNLTRVIAELRDAIGDDAREPQLIRTIHGYGYAFQGPASAGRTNAPHVFKLIWGDREIALVDGENVLGRDPLSVVCVDVGSVSRHHARIVIEGDQATLEDLGSKNGTFLKNRRLKEPAALRDGDEIRVGTVPMIVRRFAPGGTTETAPKH